MIDRREHQFHRGKRLHVSALGPPDHDDLDAERTGGDDLGVCRRSPAVLGDNRIDTVGLQKRYLVLHHVGAAIEDQLDSRQCERRINGIDTSHEIEMLGLCFRQVRLLATNCQKSTARGGAKRIDRLCDRRNMCPPVFELLAPFRPTQSESGYASRLARLTGVLRYPRGEGVRCVDQKIELTCAEKAGQSFRATKATHADRYSLAHRFLGTASQGQQNLVRSGRGKRLRQDPRIPRATQYQDTGLFHV